MISLICESNEETGLTNKIVETDSYKEQDDSYGGRGHGQRLEESSPKEEGLIDMDNSVVTAGPGGGVSG